LQVLENELYLSKIVKKVYLVHRREELRASKILQRQIISEGKVRQTDCPGNRRWLQWRLGRGPLRRMPEG
jgi:hypothetical protein